MASSIKLPNEEVNRPLWPGSQSNISYGLPFPEACAKHAKDTFHASRIYILASGSLSRNTNHVQRLQEALGPAVVGTRYGMQPHSLWSEILEVTQEASAVGAELLITLGAGSLTDAAKIVSLAMANQARTFDDLDRLHTTATNPKQDVQAPSARIICIPTSLSGGEYSHGAGGSNDRNHRKYAFAHEGQRPALVILDPALTRTTPDRWWISTGVRAVDHCVEGMCALTASETCVADCSRGLRLLVPGLLRCKRDNGDVEARFLCQMGVIEAMKPSSLHGVQMGASHGIGHQLGPLGVGHGETSCILLPAVCKWNVSVNGERQEQTKEVLWSEAEVEALLKDAGVAREADLGDVLDAIFMALGMPRTLKQFDIGDEKLGPLAENSLQDRWLPTNPRPITEKWQVLEILEMVKG